MRPFIPSFSSYVSYVLYSRFLFSVRFSYDFYCHFYLRLTVTRNSDLPVVRSSLASFQSVFRGSYTRTILKISHTFVYFLFVCWSSLKRQSSSMSLVICFLFLLIKVPVVFLHVLSLLSPTFGTIWCTELILMVNVLSLFDLWLDWVTKSWSMRYGGVGL